MGVNFSGTSSFEAKSGLFPETHKKTPKHIYEEEKKKKRKNR
jgi:hypothetical protein